MKIALFLSAVMFGSSVFAGMDVYRGCNGTTCHDWRTIERLASGDICTQGNGCPTTCAAGAVAPACQSAGPGAQQGGLNALCLDLVSNGCG